MFEFRFNQPAECPRTSLLLSSPVETTGAISAVRHGTSGHQRATRAEDSGSTVSRRLRNRDARSRTRSRDEQALHGFRPRMQREVERSPVHRDQDATAHEPVRLDRLLRPEVDVGPERVVRADLDQRCVERAQAISDLPRRREHGGVAAVVDAVLRSADRPAGPERRSRSDITIERPEKWRAGVAVRVSAPTGVSAHQSSSTIRSEGMPQRSGAHRPRAAPRSAARGRRAPRSSDGRGGRSGRAR